MWQPSSNLRYSGRLKDSNEAPSRWNAKLPELDDLSIRRRTILDHRDKEVKVVWNPQNNGLNEPIDSFPLYSFEIYLLHGAHTALQDVDKFANDLLSFIGVQPVELRSDMKDPYRLDIYIEPFQNVLSCLAHRRKEIHHRLSERAYPRLVSEWRRYRDRVNEKSYQSRIVVIDGDDWQERGPIVVLSDCEFDDAEYLESILEGDGAAGFAQTLAERINDQMVFRDYLLDWKYDAERQTLEDRGLHRAFSPVRYPALDPLAHHDAEYDSVSEPADPQVESVAGFDFFSDDQQAVLRGLGVFDQSELHKTAAELRPICSETYSDDFGSSIASVWNSAMSRTRPITSFILYLAFGLPSFEAEALFASLNKGQIGQEAWTLDIIRNIPSIDAALDYHTRASARRTAKRTAAMKSRMRRLLMKTPAKRLPVELIAYIEELSISPAIPDYSHGPTQPFRNIFMYLSRDRVKRGPLLVYSNNALCETGSDRRGAPLSMEHSPREERFRAEESRNTFLEVKELPFWSRASDEIHNLWGFVAYNRADGACHASSRPICYRESSHGR